MSLTYLRIAPSMGTWMRLRCFSRSGLQVVIAVLVLASFSLAHADQQTPLQGKSVDVERLMARVGPPSQEAVDEFKKAGMENVKPHTLTAAERGKVDRSIRSLPALSRRVLESRLRYLAFVDGIPGEGTGLTSPVAKTGLYDITLRSSIIDEPLSTFLTTKERRVFSETGSGVRVTVRGTGTDALTYVLLHESSHVMDFACGVTTQPNNRFVAGVWKSTKAMIPQLASTSAAATYFRGAPKLDDRRAVALYDSLAHTPFVSLYATASPREDFAELLAWDEILKQHHGGLEIEVDDAHGSTLGRWQPLTFPGVQKRLSDVDKLLVSPASCSDLDGKPLGAG